MAKLGDYYTLTKQPFVAVSGQVYESRLVLGKSVPGSAYAMSLTPPTANRQPVHGDLVLVDNDGCDEADYPSGLKGNIAFVLRGSCPFGTKSELAGKAGDAVDYLARFEFGEEWGSIFTREAKCGNMVLRGSSQGT